MWTDTHIKYNTSTLAVLACHQRMLVDVVNMNIILYSGQDQLHSEVCQCNIILQRHNYSKFILQEVYGRSMELQNC